MPDSSTQVTSEYHLSQAGLTALPIGWSAVALGSLLSDNRGISVGVMYPGKHDPAGIPLIKAGDLVGNLINPTPAFHISPKTHYEYRRTQLEGREILMTLVGDIGQCAVVADEMIGWNAARAIAVIRLKDSNEADYVRQCLLSRPLQHLMDVWANTTVQPTLNLKEVKQLPIPWPPKHERDEIASIGRFLDDKIDLNRRMNRALEQTAAASFKAWFVDFENVKAKAAGATRFPTMPQPVFDALPAEFADSPLGPIPKGWKVGVVSDIADPNGWTLGKRDELDLIEYVEISEVMRGDINKLSNYERGTEPSRARRRLRHGDTVMSTVRPDRGAYFLCLNPSPNLIASTGFVTLSPNAVPWSFVHAAMARNDVLEELGRLADGGAYPAIRPEVVGNLPITIPNCMAVADAFHAVAGTLYEKADLNRRESKTLADIRDALLPRLLSGEIRVGAAEKIVEEVA